MGSARMEMSGREFDCVAKPRAWPHGAGVAVEIFATGELVGVVVVLCSRGSADFAMLSSLPPDELCTIALSRFVAGNLRVTLDKVMDWQEKVRAVEPDGVSPLYCGFSPTGSFPEGLVRLPYAAP